VKFCGFEIAGIGVGVGPVLELELMVIWPQPIESTNKIELAKRKKLETKDLDFADFISSPWRKTSVLLV
jgi:hypothetical protein